MRGGAHAVSAVHTAQSTRTSMIWSGAHQRASHRTRCTKGFAPRVNRTVATVDALACYSRAFNDCIGTAAAAGCYPLKCVYYNNIYIKNIVSTEMICVYILLLYVYNIIFDIFYVYTLTVYSIRYKSKGSVENFSVYIINYNL